MTYSQFFYGLLTAIITAPLAAWVTARFALRRFYAEKVWERKVAAYTEIMGALHDMSRWFDAHVEATIGKRSPLTEEIERTLLDDYQKARRNLDRHFESERWIISDDCVDILTDVQKKLNK